MAYETFGNSAEQKKGVESDIETIEALHKRDQLLQQQWAELFAKTNAIEAKYPREVKFDSQQRYKSDASFLTPEDRAAFLALKESLTRIESERDELDAEIIKKRFNFGATRLAEINQLPELVWQETNEHTPDPENNLDTTFARQWRVQLDDSIAEVNMTGIVQPSLFDELQQAAEALQNPSVAEAMKHLPKGRDLEFSEIRLSFSVSPLSISPEKRDAVAPNLIISKQFDTYTADADAVTAELPLNHVAYAIPRIDEHDQLRAQKEMAALAQRLGIASFE